MKLVAWTGNSCPNKWEKVCANVGGDYGNNWAESGTGTSWDGNKTPCVRMETAGTYTDNGNGRKIAVGNELSYGFLFPPRPRVPIPTFTARACPWHKLELRLLSPCLSWLSCWYKDTVGFGTSVPRCDKPIWPFGTFFLFMNAFQSDTLTLRDQRSARRDSTLDYNSSSSSSHAGLCFCC